MIQWSYPFFFFHSFRSMSFDGFPPRTSDSGKHGPESLDAASYARSRQAVQAAEQARRADEQREAKLNQVNVTKIYWG
jgi:hypothetical protein